jgi:DNA-binding GntR family transcriptional regulator
MTGRLEAVQVRSLSREAAGKIRQAIAAGHFAPGTRLVEATIAQELGLSRSPVREALYFLEQEGLIVRHPRRGAFVRGLSNKETEEIFGLRTVLETFALHRAMAGMTPHRITQLNEILARMRAAAECSDVDALSEIDAEFHETITQMADHKVLEQVLTGLHSRTVQYMVEASHSRPLALIVADHEEMVRAIASGDLVAAESALRQHILTSAQRLLSNPASSAVGPEEETTPPGPVRYDAVAAGRVEEAEDAVIEVRKKEAAVADDYRLTD